MLKLAVYTKIKSEDVLERAIRYFIDEQKLTPVEIVAHMHSDTGAAEVRAIGHEIGDGTTRLSEEVLWSGAKHLQQEFGFEVVRYALHAHASPNAEIGHLVISISAGQPTEVDFETHELEYQVREFADKLPTVKAPAGV